MKKLQFTLILGLIALFSVPVTTVASDRSMSRSGAQDSSSKPMSILEGLAESDSDEDEQNPGAASLSLADLSEAASSRPHAPLNKSTGNSYYCRVPGCNFEETYVERMRAHYLEHGGVFKCPDSSCPYMHKNFSTLRAHALKWHPKVQCYTEGQYFSELPKPANPADATVVSPLALTPAAQSQPAPAPKRTTPELIDLTGEPEGKKPRMVNKPPYQLPRTMAQVVAATSDVSWAQQSVAPPAQAPQAQPVMPNLPLAIASYAMSVQQQFAAQREQFSQALDQYRLSFQRQEYERQQQEASLRQAAHAEQALIQHEAMRLMIIAASVQAQQQAAQAQPQAPVAQPQPAQVTTSSPKFFTSIAKYSSAIFRCNICHRRGQNRTLEIPSNAKRHQRRDHADHINATGYDISALINGEWIPQNFPKSKPKTKKS